MRRGIVGAAAPLRFQGSSVIKVPPIPPSCGSKDASLAGSWLDDGLAAAASRHNCGILCGLLDVDRDRRLRAGTGWWLGIVGVPVEKGKRVRNRISSSHVYAYMADRIDM